MQTRWQVENASRKLRRTEDLKIEYEEIIHQQLEQGVVEKEPEQPTGPHVFIMPHKPVVREEATTAKERMVFCASAKPVSYTHLTLPTKRIV